MNSEIMAIINRYKKLLKKEAIPIKEMVLFGSHSLGTAKKYSDIDICLISPIFGKDSLEERKLLSKIADQVDWRLEPHPYHSKDFEVEEDPFAAEIKRTGIKV